MRTTAPVLVSSNPHPPVSTWRGGLDHVSVVVAGQVFGIPIDRIRDVFMVHSLTPVPLAGPDILGLINLRGRVATAICLRRRLGLPPIDSKGLMAVGIEAGTESYGLVVESVGEVVQLGHETRDENPVHLSAPWAALSRGVHRLADKLLVVLDVDAVLGLRDTGSF